MGDVIDLPSRAEQGLAFLETEIRKLMTEQGESEAAIKIALQTLKDVYQRYGELGKQSFTLSLPTSMNDTDKEHIREQINQGLQMIIEHHSHMLNRLAAELVITKVKLFELQQSQHDDEQP